MKEIGRIAIADTCTNYGKRDIASVPGIVGKWGSRASRAGKESSQVSLKGRNALNTRDLTLAPNISSEITSR